MKALLNNQFAPITYSWGFLDFPFQQMVEQTISWINSIFSKVGTTPLNTPLEDSLAHLEPLMTPPRNHLLLRTQSSWAAYFNNGINGGDPAGFIGYMSERLHCRGLAVTCIPHVPPADNEGDDTTYDAVRFELYAPTKQEWLNIERSVAVVNDAGEWTFKTTGTPRSFEKLEQYEARAIKDRFTSEMLEEYCAALGIRAFDDDFYGPEGLLIEVTDPLPPAFMPVTLAETRKRLGLKDSK